MLFDALYSETDNIRAKQSVFKIIEITLLV